jgi:hypothetical protein
MEIKFRIKSEYGKKEYIYFNLPWNYNESFSCDLSEIEDKSTLAQYINLNDINGDEIYENDMLIDRKNGNCFNVFRVAGGFGINAHKSDFNFEKRPSIFYESVAEPRISKYISGNCEIIK